MARIPPVGLVGTNLRAVREAQSRLTGRKIYQRDVANLLGVKEDTYRSYEYGRSQLPEDLAKKLSAEWQIDWRSLYRGGPLRVQESSDNGPRVSPLKSLAGTPLAPVPIVGYVSAGPGAVNVDPEYGVVYVPEQLASAADVGFILDGDSLMPILEAGVVTLYKNYPTPRARFPFLIKTADAEFRVKRLIWKDNRWHYNSVNPNYKDEPMHEGDQLLGYMVGWYRSVGRRETLDSDRDGLMLLGD